MSIIKYLKVFQLKKIKDDYLLFLWKIIPIIIVLFSFVIFLESIFWFPASLKIFFKSMIIMVFLSILFFLLTIFFLFKMNKLKRYSYEKIAIEVGEKHLESKDELLNAMQLENEISLSQSSSSLIKQLIANVNIQISKINIDIKKLPKKILKQRNQTIFISFIFSIIFFIYLPELIFSSYRLIHSSKEFNQPTPFSIKSLKKNIYIMGGDSAKVVFFTSGNHPDSIQIEFLGENFRKKNMG